MGLVLLSELVLAPELDSGQLHVDDYAVRERNFRRRLAEAGVVVRWPEGPSVRPEERPLIHVEGKPISEQVIEDRR